MEDKNQEVLLRVENLCQYFGPTKLEISLVWLIGCGNYNKDKGGKR